MSNITDTTGRAYRKYRQLRREGWLALPAARHVMADEKLAELETYGVVEFERVIDYDYDPYDSDDDYGQNESAKLESGEWEVYGIIATARKDACCISCHQSVPETSASLWGIVVDKSGDDYLRDVEIELAAELGVI